MKRLLFCAVAALIATVSAYAQKVYSTNYEYQADVKVYVVDYEYQADLKIFFVKNEYQAGWRDKSKMHLLY